MDAQEVGEVLNDDIVHPLIVEVVADEFRHRGQPSVGQRLTVHAVDDLFQRELGLCLEGLQHVGREYPAVEVVQESLAQGGPTALVAEDIAQRGRVLHDAVAVVETRVGTRSEDAGDALLAATEGAGGTQQVAVSLHDRCLGEQLAEQRRHQLLHLRAHTAAVEVDGVREVGRQDRPAAEFLYVRARAHRPHKLLADDLHDLLARLMDGVDALCREDYWLRAGCNDGPVCFSASAICYEYHIRKF